MDVVQGIKFGIEFCPEPDESLIPVVLFRIGLFLGRLDGVIPPPLPRRLPGPLGTRRGCDGWEKGDSRWGGTLWNHISE